jgi:hypothetical protein
MHRKSQSEIDRDSASGARRHKMVEYNSRPASTQQPTQIISLSCLPKFDFMDADSTAAQNKSKKNLN